MVCGLFSPPDPSRVNWDGKAFSVHSLTNPLLLGPAPRPVMTGPVVESYRTVLVIKSPTAADQHSTAQLSKHKLHLHLYRLYRDGVQTPRRAPYSR